jgi:hypothetical protein
MLLLLLLFLRTYYFITYCLRPLIFSDIISQFQTAAMSLIPHRSTINNLQALPECEVFQILDKIAFYFMVIIVHRK